MANVEEFTGISATCTTTGGTVYATTTYHYDVLGNLRSVTDAKGNQSEMQYDTLSRKIFMHDPDMGDWTYQYDPAGNLEKQTDAKGQMIWFQYDALNRRVQKDYATQKAQGSGDVVYTYDGTTDYRKGRLQKVDDASGTVTFAYDIMGRILRTNKELDSTTYITQSTYDGLGRLKTVNYPDASVVHYAYDGPLLDTVFDGATTYVHYTGYNALGQAGAVIYGNGVITTYDYSQSTNSTCPAHNFRLCTLQTTFGTNPAYQNLLYGYEDNGNIQTITDTVNGNQSFGYDDINRLTTATGPYGTLTYGYDQIGNMTDHSRVGTYGYPISGAGSIRPHAVTSAGSNTYAYDANGNMTSGAGRTINYDTENRPVTVTLNGETTTFLYDGDGGRVKKVTSTTTTRYIGQLFECDNASCARYIFAGGQRIAVVPSSGGTFYYHTDHLSSTSVITDDTGAKVQALTYYPYGETRTNIPGSPVDVPYKYTNKELDDSTGLYFYEARYYDPMLGRFTSPDTIIPNWRDPQAFNRYTYVRNNPLRFTDPSGHGWFDDLIDDIGEWIDDAIEYSDDTIDDALDWLREHEAQTAPPGDPSCSEGANCGPGVNPPLSGIRGYQRQAGQSGEIVSSRLSPGTGQGVVSGNVESSYLGRVLGISSPTMDSLLLSVALAQKWAGAPFVNGIPGDQGVGLTGGVATGGMTSGNVLMGSGQGMVVPPTGVNGQGNPLREFSWKGLLDQRWPVLKSKVFSVEQDLALTTSLSQRFEALPKETNPSPGIKVGPLDDPAEGTTKGIPSMDNSTPCSQSQQLKDC